MMKKIFASFLALAIAVSGLAVAFKPIASSAAIDFSCGNGVRWYLDTGNAVLTINGEGEMDDYGNSGLDLPPWYEYKSQIRSVVIGEGVASIGEYAFYNATNLKTVQLPSTLKRIEEYSLIGCKNISDISVAENSELRMIHHNTGLSSSKWYTDQPDGSVYLGNAYYSYKGTLPDDSTVEISDGTTAIASRAFYNQSGLSNVTFPGTVEYIGADAFTGTAWYDTLPEGAVYIDKTFFRYIGTVTLEESDFVVADGTVSVSANALRTNGIVKSVQIPSSVKIIGEGAFSNKNTLTDVYFSSNSRLEIIAREAFSMSKLKNCVLPERLKVIESNAFSNYNVLSSVVIPSTVEHIGSNPWSGISRLNISVDPLNSYYSSDDKGVIFNKVKTVLYFTPSYFYSDYSVPEGVKTIKSRAFVGIMNGCTITIPSTVEYIGRTIFADRAEIKVIFLNMDCACSSMFSNMPGSTVYCYTDSAAHKQAIFSNVPFVLLDAEGPDTEKLILLIEQANSLERDLYNEDSFAVLDEAVSNVDLDAQELTQSQVDEWETAIKEAIKGLKYRPADYYSVELAKKNAQAVDQSLYTAQSLSALNDAVSAIVYDLDITKQAQVNSFAKNIMDAIEELEYLPADYSSVVAAMEAYNSVDRDKWTQTSLVILDQCVQVVEYGLNITNQSKVDAYASSIEKAIEELEYDPVILRNEPNGVIVSATTREINKETVLAVEKRDPSDFEGSNFAVGGSVVSMNFYDINLINSGEKVQPNGSVLVKIKLAEGVRPEKCKVYHVSNDMIDPLVKVTSTIDGNYIVFNTEHFSEFAVIEVETVVTDITVASLPDKTEYITNEPLSFVGLEVVANMSDGTIKTVYDYEVGMIDMSKPGEKTVNIYYTYGEITKIVSFRINVSYPSDTVFVKNVKINAPSTLSYGKSAVLTLDVDAGAQPYTVEWSTSNGSIATVDENGVVTAMGRGEAAITAKITNPDGSTVTETAKINCTMTFWQRIVVFFKRFFNINSLAFSVI